LVAQLEPINGRKIKSFHWGEKKTSGDMKPRLITGENAHLADLTEFFLRNGTQPLGTYNLLHL